MAKSTLQVTVRLEQVDDIESKIEATGPEALRYDRHEGGYKIWLGAQDLERATPMLRDLIEMAHHTYHS